MRLLVLTKKLLPVSRIANVQFLGTSSGFGNFQICLDSCIRCYRTSYIVHLIRYTLQWTQIPRIPASERRVTSRTILSRATSVCPLCREFLMLASRPF